MCVVLTVPTTSAFCVGDTQQHTKTSQRSAHARKTAKSSAVKRNEESESATTIVCVCGETDASVPWINTCERTARVQRTSCSSEPEMRMTDMWSVRSLQVKAMLITVSFLLPVSI